MTIEQAFDKYRKHIINAVEENTELYWNKKSFVYTFYIKPSKELMDDIIESVCDEVLSVLDERTNIMFDEDNVRGFIVQNGIISFEKYKL